MIKDIKRSFTAFLQTFEQDGLKKYLNLIDKMSNNSSHLLIISFQDFTSYNPDLATLIFSEYQKYEPILNEALTTYMKEYDKHQMVDETKSSKEDKEEKYGIAFDRGF